MMRISNDSRTGKSIHNIGASLLLKIFQILLPFVSRTIIIKEFGVEYTGISGLFASIIGMLGLADLGMTNALNYALYKPIEERNIKKTNEVLNLYRKSFTIIGVVILGLGLAIVPFLEFFIKEGTYPSGLNLQLLYVGYLVNTVCTYMLFAYNVALIEAFQLGFKVTLIRARMLILQYLAQIAVLVLLKDYYLYTFALPVFSIMTSLAIARYSRVRFPEYRPSGKLEREESKKIFRNIKAGLLYKIGSVIYNSGDSMIISYFLGAAVLGVFNSYYYILSALFMVLGAIYTPMIPSIGNSIVTDSKEKNYSDFLNLTYVYNWLIGWCTICLLCILQPFMRWWLGEEMLLDHTCVIFFVIYFYVFRMRDIIGIYKDAAGQWVKDQYRPIIGGVANIILNIVFVKYFGVMGVLIASIITVALISYPLSLKVILDYFGVRSREYHLMQIRFVLSIVISALITYGICELLFHSDHGGIVNIVLRALICIAVPNVIVYLLNHRDARFKEAVKFMKQKIKIIFSKNTEG
ncbi:MAG: oligosaccharide flippase family protein [Eubacterium sp.]|nr:oligosaccharide flippase family protein [Eubacterium sp.]MCM1342931.1 oligosaccharide flippase family protein [Muribaculaceae bacterium]MCM1411377.1 oligosaccharide flippase family protein [Lachnospiraceae bacterium]